MIIDEILTKERERYFTFLRQGFKFGKTEYDSPATEILVRLNSEKLKELPEVFQLYRYDLIYKGNDGKIKINEYRLDSFLNYPQYEFNIGKTKVLISPFLWNECEITLNKKPNEWSQFY